MLLSIRKKKPLVPKTFNLFDAEHDKYFGDLEGEPGCFMVRKWKRFSKQVPDFGEPPYVCDICGEKRDLLYFYVIEYVKVFSIPVFREILHQEAEVQAAPGPPHGPRLYPLLVLRAEGQYGPSD